LKRIDNLTSQGYFCNFLTITELKKIFNMLMKKYYVIKKARRSRIEKDTL